MVAVLGLVVLATVVLVTVVDVLVVVAAGFSSGFAVGPVVSSPAAGLASAGDLLELSPGTLSPSVSPAGGVAASGSIYAGPSGIFRTLIVDCRFLKIGSL